MKDAAIEPRTAPTALSVMTLALLVALVAGCGGLTPERAGDDVEYREGDDVERREAAIRNGSTNSTNVSYAAVGLRLNNSTCSGIQLSRHWILTAAHCVYPRPAAQTVRVSRLNFFGQTVTAYNGAATYYPHPDFHPGLKSLLSPGDSAADIALVRLHGAGISSFRRARLHRGVLLPPAGTDFFITGYGRGSAPGSGGCPSTVGIARVGRFRFGFGSTPWTARGRAPIFGEQTCTGDSGSGWYIERAGRQYFFAVLSSSDIHDACNCNVPGMGFTGARIFPRVDWIVRTSQGTQHPLTCRPESARDFLSYVHFTRCVESSPRAPVVPTPVAPTSCRQVGGRCSRGPCQVFELAKGRLDCKKPAVQCCVRAAR